MIYQLKRTIKMPKSNKYKYMGIACLTMVFGACHTPVLVNKKENRAVPASFGKSLPSDTVNTAKVKWKDFFSDPFLQSLVYTALSKKQEHNINLREI